MKKFLAVLLCIPLCTLMLTACNIPFFHIHTYEYICNEDSHHKVFTCGCPTPDISEEHIDHDADMRCDICGYSMWERSKWHYSDTHHWQTPEGEAVFTPVYGYGVHIDEDTNCKCDICGYLMLEPIVIEWQYNDTHHWLPEGDFFLQRLLISPHIDEDKNGICDVCNCGLKAFIEQNR